MILGRQTGLSLSQAVQSQIVSEYVKRAAKPRPPVRTDGRPTGMTCECGGALEATLPDSEWLKEMIATAAGPLPRHRKRRIQKKWAKRHEERCRIVALPVLGLAAHKKPSFACIKCGQTHGFYQALGWNLFKVEPLPPGALPIYDKDIDVPSFLGGDP